MILSTSEKMIKKRRELLAVYVTIDKGLWRRIYPESFYAIDGFVSAREMEYVELIYQVFLAAINGYRKTLVEDEINLMYMEMESRTALGKFSEEALAAIQRRLDLRKQTIEKIEALTRLPDFAQKPPNIRFRLENTVYLVRLLAYGLFSNNDIVLDRVAEVFDITRLQAATKPKDRPGLDDALKFLYRGLIQKNESGRQGNRHAARQTLSTLKEWFPDNEYVMMCIEKIERYV